MSFDENSPVEYFENAKINFENLARMNPALKDHPMFVIAMDQLKNGIEQLENREA